MTCALLPMAKAPSAEPPIVSISNGSASRIATMLPPASVKPPNTQTSRNTNPPIGITGRSFRMVPRKARKTG